MVRYVGIVCLRKDASSRISFRKFLERYSPEHYRLGNFIERTRQYFTGIRREYISFKTLENILPETVRREFPGLIFEALGIGISMEGAGSLH